MLLLFVFLALVLEIISSGKLSPSLLKKQAVLLLPAIVLWQQLWVTKYMMASVGGIFTGKFPAPFTPGIPVVSYSTLHWLTMAFAAAGAFFLAYSYKKRELRYLSLWFIVFSAACLTNWVGIPFWSERIRYTSYLLFYPLSAIGVFFISKLVEKRFRPVVWAVAFILILAMALPGNAREIYGERQYLMTPEMYDALLWLRDNTPEDATVFFFDGYWQGTAAYSRRLGTDLRPSDMEKLAQPGLIEFWEYSTFGYHQKMPYKTGLFSFGNYQDIPGVNLCEMDYKIFVNYQQLMPVLEKYEQKLAETNEVAYNQNGIIIFKNKDGEPGCLR